jgi:hypothetical protein
MRDYGTVHTQFWIHPVYSRLSVSAKLIAVYLLTCPHTNMLGCFRLPEEYIAVDLLLDKSSVHKALEELTKVNFLSVDFQHGWILIHSFLEWNPIENPNQAKNIIKIFEKTPSQLNIYPKLIEILSTISEQFDEGFQDRLQTLLKGFRNHSETLSELFRNQEQDQEQEQKQDQEQEQEVSAAQKSSGTFSEVMIAIPLSGGGEYPIIPSQISQWGSLYPAVDILQALRNIRGWNLANPKRRKTQSGVLSHINTWLAKEQNNAGKSALSANNRAPPYKNSLNLQEHNSRVAEQWLRESETKIVEGEILK